METQHPYERGSSNGLCKLCGRDALHPIHVIPEHSLLRAAGEELNWPEREPKFVGHVGRKRMPQRRMSLTFDFEHQWDDGQTFLYRATISYYEDGKIGELFLNSSKRLGTALDANARDAAIFVSIALQYGAPIDVLRKAQARNSKGYPASPVGMALDEIVVHGWELAEVTSNKTGEPK